MNIDYDRVADALYFRLSQKEIVKTVPLEGNIVADLDADGSVVGLEMLHASSHEDLEQYVMNGIPVTITQATSSVV